MSVLFFNIEISRKQRFLFAKRIYIIIFRALYMYMLCIGLKRCFICRWMNCATFQCDRRMYIIIIIILWYEINSMISNGSSMTSAAPTLVSCRLLCFYRVYTSTRTSIVVYIFAARKANGIFVKTLKLSIFAVIFFCIVALANFLSAEKGENIRLENLLTSFCSEENREATFLCAAASWYYFLSLHMYS